MLGYVTSKVIMKDNVCAVVSDPMQIIMSQEDFIIKNLSLLENKKYLQILELERPTDMAMLASTMFSNRIPLWTFRQDEGSFFVHLVVGSESQ